MEELLIIGTPLSLGIFVSGLAQIIKQSPVLPFVQKGKPWMIRLTVAVLALFVQVAANYLKGAPLSGDLLLNSFVTYVTAAASYDHIFKNLGK